MPEEEIVGALTGSGQLPADRSQAEERLGRLLQFETSFTQLTGGVACVPRLLEGTRWTAWIDADDAAQGFVRTKLHLEPLSWWLVGDEVPLLDAEGQAVATLETDGLWLDGADTDVVIGPPGWLDGLAGGWVTVEVVGGGLRWTTCPQPPEPTEAQVVALREGFERAADTVTVPSYDERGEIELRTAVGDDPVHEALVVDRAAFVDAPIPPLPELFRAAGLEQRGGIVAAEGFDWDAFAGWQRRRRLGVINRLDDDLVERLVVALGACRAVLADGDAALGPDDDQRFREAVLLAGLLEEGAVTEAFWREALAEGLDPADVDRFVGVLDEWLDGDLTPGLAWLRARALEADGAVAAALAVLEVAVTPGCTHVPALLELAGYRSDQGDAPAALRLLQRAGITHEGHHGEHGSRFDLGHQLLHEVALPATHRPPATARRNDPCPCGSGRKYKACHLGKELHTLADRSFWLYEKAKRYVWRHGDELLHDLAETMADPIDDGPMYEQLLASSLPTDLALHEGGLIRGFLESRRALLPDDEALLALQWALVDRSVFEVERVGHDHLGLYDLGRSERITVVNTLPSDQTRPGRLLLGRPLPVGDTYRAFSGFLAITRESVSPLLDAIEEDDPFAVADEIAELFRPPTLRNTDGQDIAFHTLRWRVADPSTARSALQAAGLTADDDAGPWRLVRDTRNGRDTIIATLRLDRDVLVGEVNSDERAAELRALVAAALPEAVLLDDAVRDLDDELDDDLDDDLDQPAAPDLDDPELRRMLEALVLEHEERWLDESIPALGGRTPREAAGDPIGREELRHLLAMLPPATALGMMSADRLRRALGLHH